MKSKVFIIVLFSIEFLLECVSTVHLNVDVAVFPFMPIAAAGSIASGLFSSFSARSQQKKMMAAQREAERKASIARGAAMLNEDQALMAPSYDDNPFTDNQRKLYEEGGWVDMTNSLANSFNQTASAYVGNLNATDQANAIANKTPAALTNRVSGDANKDKERYNKLFANPFEDIAENPPYAKGGLVNPFNNNKGVNQQSSNTAMIMAGNHESGNDLQFTRATGTKAKVEGGEGMKTGTSGVQIYSDRVKVPGTNSTIADEFSRLSFSKGDLEAARNKESNAIARTTLDRKILGLDNTLDNLFSVQENAKTNANFKSNAGEVDGQGQVKMFWGGGTDKNAEVKNLVQFKPAYLDPTKPSENIDGSVYDPYENVVNTPFSGNVTEDVAGTSEGSDKKPKNNTLWNTLKSDDGLDGIATGLTLLDNVFNLGRNPKVNIGDPHLTNKVDLDKEYRTDAAEAGIKKELDNFYKNVDRNTNSSVVGLNMKLAAMADGIDKLNSVYDTKEKFETEMRNKEIIANSGIETQNANAMNQFDLTRAQLNKDAGMFQSANLTNAINDTVNGILRFQDRRTDKAEFMSKERVAAVTGVTMSALKDGQYSNMTKDDLNKMIETAGNGGYTTYETYKEGVEGHNKNATAGSVVEVMTKEEYYKKFPKAKKSPVESTPKK